MTRSVRIECPTHRRGVPGFGCRTCRTATAVEDAYAAHQRSLEPDDEGFSPHLDAPPVKAAWDALVAAQARHTLALLASAPEPPGVLFDRKASR